MSARTTFLAAGLVVLALAWSGILALPAPGPFSAQMGVHVAVVAVAAPLLALGIADGRFDPARRHPWLAAPVPAMLAELVVVWGWHLPLLHHAARTSTAALVAEQASFLAVGLALWLSVLGGDAAQRRARLAGGVIALLLTSMHMTLLGALITLAPRALWHGSGSIADQQVAGMVMLSAAVSYLAGGLWAVSRLLRDEKEEPGRAPLG